jgi:hypothetical protein
MAVPVPQNTVYARWNFLLASGGANLETASIGLHATRVHTVANPIDWPADLQAWCDDHSSMWATAFDGMKTITGSAVTLDTVELYLIDATTGKAAAKGLHTMTGTDRWKGTSDHSLPFQCSLVVSLYGYTPGGFAQDAPSKRGRFYLPPFSDDALDVDGRMDGTTQGNVSVWATAFLNDFQGSHIGDVFPGQDSDFLDLRVLSLVSGKEPRPVGVMTPVTDVRIGRVIDTQRRRRKSLEEAYVDTDIDRS